MRRQPFHRRLIQKSSCRNFVQSWREILFAMSLLEIRMSTGVMPTGVSVLSSKAKHSKAFKCSVEYLINYGAFNTYNLRKNNNK